MTIASLLAALLLLHVALVSADNAVLKDKKWEELTGKVAGAVIKFKYDDSPSKYIPSLTRAKEIYGILPYKMTVDGIGSSAYEEETRGWRELEKDLGTPVNHGHLLAKSLGGSGIDARNIIAQTVHSNLEQEKIESAVRTFIRTYQCTVKFEIDVRYAKNKEYASKVIYRMFMIDTATLDGSVANVKQFPWFIAEIPNDAKSPLEVVHYVSPANNMRKSCTRVPDSSYFVDFVEKLWDASNTFAYGSKFYTNPYSSVPMNEHMYAGAYAPQALAPQYGSNFYPGMQRVTEKSEDIDESGRPNSDFWYMREQQRFARQPVYAW